MFLFLKTELSNEKSSFPAKVIFASCCWASEECVDFRTLRNSGKDVINTFAK
jgi:hypothetical protein